MNSARDPAVWFPTVHTGTGTDVFTERLAEGLAKRGIRSGITWLPLRAEYAPWTVAIPKPPAWANVAHVNTWLHPRFLPKHLPVVATIHHAVHHPDAETYKGAIRSAYHRFWIAPNERRVLRRADCITAVSRFVADATKQTLLDASIQVVYNGVDTDLFRPGSRYRQPNEAFRLLYVGSWTARKAVDLLAPIMSKLGRAFELRYTGGATAGQDKNNMSPNMHDIGRLRGDYAVVTAMQGADALLFPSRSEGFGLVAAEAMACRLPVIASRGSSLVEIVEDDVTGVLCAQDDVDAFAAAAGNLARDHEMWQRMADAARNRAVGQFALGSMVDAYIGLYRESISRWR